MRNPSEIREAAEKGYPSGQYLLGRMHLDGVGVKQDVEAAMIWLRRAAHQGHVEAQFRLGEMMAEADVEFKLGENAEKWFRKAADQGHEEARANTKIGVNTDTP